jgi:sulfonate transport system ATP-binding protein
MNNMNSQTYSACGASVVLENLTKTFDGRPVLRGVDLEIPPGQFLAIVGKSGSGKSTLLRLLSELETPSSGSVRVVSPEGQDERATVRVVFQEPRLLPWRSVVDNVRIATQGGDAQRALDVLAAVGLSDRGHEYPGVLSGGQRQRVALARALVHEPCVLLLDEPFGALDALTRIEAQRLVERLWLERGFTAVLVTHDVGEAALLADRVLLIEDGVIARRFDIAVPRPRRRGDPEVARITESLLEAIFGGVAEERTSSHDSPSPIAEPTAVRTHDARLPDVHPALSA